MRIVFGAGTLTEVAAEARTLSNRIMIISGRHEVDAAAVVVAQLGDDLAWQIPEVVQRVPMEVSASGTCRVPLARPHVAMLGGNSVGELPMLGI